MIGRLAGLGKGTAIHEDLPVLIICFEENCNDLRSLDNLAGRGNGIEIHHAVPEATLGRMPFLQVSLTLLVQRFRRWQHGNLKSICGEVLKISNVGVTHGPDSRKVGLAIRSSRRRGRQIRFSVGSPRNPWRGVILPLCGHWHRQRGENDREHNRFPTLSPSERFPFFSPVEWYRY